MYNSNFMSRDIKASIVVFLVALPLCLGISLASGAPLISGIIAGIIGGLIVGSFSGSHTSVSGPAAGLTVIVLGAISSLGSFQAFTLAVLIAGLLQILFGLFKAGSAGSYFPDSVIKGMLSAIGIILILKQIPHLVGFDSDFFGDDAFIQSDGFNTFTEIIAAFNALDLGASIIGIGCLLLMIFWDKLKNKNVIFNILPAPLMAVLLGIFLNQLFVSTGSSLAMSAEHMVNLPISDGLSSFLSALILPDFSQFSNPQVYKVAITLAIVASLETLLSVEAVDKLDPFKNTTNKNRELFAQGLGNTVAGLVGALPVTSVIVRSSANVGSNNATKMSAILHAVWMFLAVCFAPSLIEMIPLASLAAILLIVGYKLAKPSLFKQIYSEGLTQFLPFVITILAIVFTDLLTGIIIGVIVGFIFIIAKSTRDSISMVNIDKRYLVRFMKDVSFLHKPKMKEILDSIPDGANVIIDGSNHLRVDNDIVAIIKEFLESAKDKNITCEIKKSTFALNDFFKE